MASEPSKVDHEDRQDLKKLIDEPRAVKPLKDIKMKVTLGAGNVKKTSIKEMEEEYKASEGGLRLLNGGSLRVPVTDYVKPKLKMKSVETIERMEKELKQMHQELISKGFTDDDVKRAINENEKSVKNQGGAAEDPDEGAKKAIKEKYAKYQKLKSEMAEVMVKEALEGLNRPGLIIRSVTKLDVWKRCSQLYTKAGISVSGVDKNKGDFKNDEYRWSLLMATP